MHARRRIRGARALAAIFFCLTTGSTAWAQALSVLPVNVLLSPGQSAASLTVTDQGTSGTAIQIRAFLWSQNDNDDQLTPSDEVVVSPPIASIAPGATQVVRLILRRPPQGREATYRILIDQLPPPAEPGIVHVVLRLSIPIFAEPVTRAVPDVQFHSELDAGKLILVGTNNGLRHESIRDILLTAGDGRKFKPAAGASPYVLPGATRRWAMIAEGSLPLPGEVLHLKARGDGGAIDRQVSIVATP